MHLRTLGPTPLPPRVREALARDMVDHRGSEFAASFSACVAALWRLFRTEHDIVILTGSGSGGLESAVVNLFSPGERVLSVTIGSFGRRFAQVAEAFGVDVVRLEFPAGDAAEPSTVADALAADPTITSVLVTHNETSTGVTNDLPEIARVVRAAGRLLVVDSVSAIGAIPLEMDAWGCDVYADEPVADSSLARHPRVVATPHLGASTVEAQEAVARQVAEQVLLVLEGKPAQFAVNAPSLAPETADLLQPYVELAGFLGGLATQLAEGRVRSVTVAYGGELAEHDTAILGAAAIRGLLDPITSERANLVNAQLVARARGPRVAERKTPDAAPFTSRLDVIVETELDEAHVGGTVVNRRPHVVQIGEFPIDLVPTHGYMLMTRHRDRPGMIGRVGTILGEADVNISAMQVGREAPRGEALMVLSVDDPVRPAVLSRLRAIENMTAIRVIELR